jgi:large subunit GTPase 1
VKGNKSDDDDDDDDEEEEDEEEEDEEEEEEEAAEEEAKAADDGKTKSAEGEVADKQPRQETSGSKDVKDTQQGGSFKSLRPYDLYSCEHLVELFRHLCSNVAEGRSPVIGMVGYPNVSRIRIGLIMRAHRHRWARVQQSMPSARRSSFPCPSLPAKPSALLLSDTPSSHLRRHFQTILFDNFVLCDCPGLVFPSFVSTKSEMVCNGILPVDQMRDFLGQCHFMTAAVLICARAGDIYLPHDSPRHTRAHVWHQDHQAS